jgi:aldose sugar dehydrogenase
LRESYSNNVFVGDYNNGSLVLDNLPDLVVDNEEEQSSIILGNGFGPITDLETGPDGYLYVLSLGSGTIYRIVPLSQAARAAETTPSTPSIDEQEQDEKDGN